MVVQTVLSAADTLEHRMYTVHSVQYVACLRLQISDLTMPKDVGILSYPVLVGLYGDSETPISNDSVA